MKIKADSIDTLGDTTQVIDYLKREDGLNSLIYNLTDEDLADPLINQTAEAILADYNIPSNIDKMTALKAIIKKNLKADSENVKVKAFLEATIKTIFKEIDDKIENVSEVKRVISSELPPEDFLKWLGGEATTLGIYWSYGSGFAYDADSNHPYRYTFVTNINKEDVDILRTELASLRFNKNEEEIRLKQGIPLNLTSVLDSDGKELLLPPEITGKTFYSSENNKEGARMSHITTFANLNSKKPYLFKQQNQEEKTEIEDQQENINKTELLYMATLHKLASSEDLGISRGEIGISIEDYDPSKDKEKSTKNRWSEKPNQNTAVIPAMFQESDNYKKDKIDSAKYTNFLGITDQNNPVRLTDFALPNQPARKDESFEKHTDTLQDGQQQYDTRNFGKGKMTPRQYSNFLYKNEVLYITLLDKVARGYSSDYSKSNNALEAERQGKFPLTHAAKIAATNFGITQSQAKWLLEKIGPCEWHHTSSHYNQTDYYDTNTDIIVDQVSSFIEDVNNKEDVIEYITNHYEKPTTTEQGYYADFDYIIWGGTRKHPTADEQHLKNVYIVEKGSFYYVYTSEGGDLVVKKKIGSNGTYVHKLPTQEEIDKEKKLEQEYNVLYNFNTSQETRDFIEQGGSWSNSGKFYPNDKKPTPEDYDAGLENFFSVGDQRVVPTTFKGGFIRQEWDGQQFVNIEDTSNMLNTYEELPEDVKIVKNELFSIITIDKIASNIPDVLYHGSQTDNITLSNKPLYLTSDYETAKMWALGYTFNFDLLEADKPTIYTIQAKMHNPKVIQTEEEYEELMDMMNIELTMSNLKNQGYDSIAYYDADTFVVFDASTQCNIIKKDIIDKDEKYSSSKGILLNKISAGQDSSDTTSITPSVTDNVSTPVTQKPVNPVTQGKGGGKPVKGPKAGGTGVRPLKALYMTDLSNIHIIADRFEDGVTRTELPESSLRRFRQQDANDKNKKEQDETREKMKGKPNKPLYNVPKKDVYAWGNDDLNGGTVFYSDLSLPQMDDLANIS